MKKTYQQLINEALEILKTDDDIFCEMVNELDSWNGYADGFRCYYMEDLNDLFYGVSLTDFLDKLGREFNHNDNFFVDTIYGIESTDSMADYYRDNVDEGELLDEIIDKRNHIYISDTEFEDLIDEIVNFSEDDEDEPDTLETIAENMKAGFNDIAAAVTTVPAPELVTE
jgi:hypothetical protein